MITITAPMPPEPGDLFLAGGIGDGPDWRATVSDLLADHDGTILNPRLANPTPAEVIANVAWEAEAIRRSQIILVWFPAGYPAAVSMFELGVCVGRGEDIVVGADPASPRRDEVVAQLAVAAPSLAVHDTLNATVAAYLASTR